MRGITTTQFEGPNACNDCHSGGTVPTVVLSGPAAVAPDSTNEYTLQVFAVGSQNRGGLNVSAPLGTLSLGGSDASNTQLLTGGGGRKEVTHTGPKAAVDGVVMFTFLWTAPSSFSSATLDAWGNAVNGSGTNSGDRAAFASLSIANAPCIGDCNDDGAVTVDELVTGVNIALGLIPVDACPAFDPSHDGAVTVDELLAAVNTALNGCP
jgi:hypothetical protein